MFTLYTFYTADHDVAGKTTNHAKAMAYKTAHPDYNMEESKSEVEVCDLPEQLQ